MKKLLICLTVLFSAFLFTNSVSAATITGKSGRVFSNVSSERVVIYDFNGINSNSISGTRYGVIPEESNYLYVSTDNQYIYNSINFNNNNFYYSLDFNRYKANSLSSWSSMSSTYFLAVDGHKYSSINDVIEYSYYDIWNNNYSEILYCGDVETECVFEPTTFNITFHLNGGVVDDNNWISGDDGSYLVGMKYEDYSVDIEAEQLMEYLINQNVSKETMQFVGWYYDEKLTQKVEATDIIDSDKHFYAKYQYKNVEDFLNNTTFNSYTFDENYQYAVISLNNQQNRDIYLGLNIFATNLEVYKYNKINLSYVQGSTSCLTPIFSKNDKYYYQLSDSLDNDYEVLILEKEKLKDNYNFLLSDNAYVTYTNDLKNVVIKDETGNDITTDIENSYDYSQDALLNSENDLLEIFKDLINNKNNNVFSYFNQVWNLMKTNKLFIYFMCLIIGSLIILIIKSASR